MDHSTNGCVESGSYLSAQQLGETVEALAPAVAVLLQRIAPTEVVSTESGGTGYRFVLPLSFPDGIGHGTVVARLFRYRDSVRLDVEIVHNRRFAKADGSPSDRRCYMNDFVASSTIAPDATELSPDFERSVLRGVLMARDGVRRHNREQAAPWNQVVIAAAE
ncbi:MAG: hypothetical protein OER90_12715 [Gemmatimonadota bacterium]|nr:hypothetical protein [Gemmatimonadota bacterium]